MVLTPDGSTAKISKPDRYKTRKNILRELYIRQIIPQNRQNTFKKAPVQN